MKTPKRIQPLIEEGLVDGVIRQIRSGKEATVYVVRCDEEIRCAKVYKEVSQRSFRQAASYQEGRKVKNSQQARAMKRGIRYGRKMQEEVTSRLISDLRMLAPSCGKFSLLVKRKENGFGFAHDVRERWFVKFKLMR